MTDRAVRLKRSTDHVYQVSGEVEMLRRDLDVWHFYSLYPLKRKACRLNSLRIVKVR